MATMVNVLSPRGKPGEIDAAKYREWQKAMVVKYGKRGTFASPEDAKAANDELTAEPEDAKTLALDFARGAVQTATFGFGDEIAAAASAPFDNADEPIGERYTRLRDFERDENTKAGERSPFVNAAGAVAPVLVGGIAGAPRAASAGVAPALRAVTTAAPTLGKIAAAKAAPYLPAAALGALGGLGMTKAETPAAALPDMTEGALLGVGTQGALEGLAHTPAAARALRDKAREGAAALPDWSLNALEAVTAPKETFQRWQKGAREGIAKAKAQKNAPIDPSVSFLPENTNPGPKPTITRSSAGKGASPASSPVPEVTDPGPSRVSALEELTPTPVHVPNKTRDATKAALERGKRDVFEEVTEPLGRPPPALDAIARARQTADAQAAQAAQTQQVVAQEAQAAAAAETERRAAIAQLGEAQAAQEAAAARAQEATQRAPWLDPDAPAGVAEIRAQELARARAVGDKARAESAPIPLEQRNSMAWSELQRSGLIPPGFGGVPSAPPPTGAPPAPPGLAPFSLGAADRAIALYRGGMKDRAQLARATGLGVREIDRLINVELFGLGKPKAKAPKTPPEDPDPAAKPATSRAETGNLEPAPAQVDKSASVEEGPAAPRGNASGRGVGQRKRVLDEILDTSGIHDHDFAAADAAYAAWRAGKGPKPPAWEGGELDALRGDKAKAPSSVLEGLERVLPARPKPEDIAKAVERLREVPGLENARVPDHIAEILLRKSVKADAAKPAPPAKPTQGQTETRARLDAIKRLAARDKAAAERRTSFDPEELERWAAENPPAGALVELEDVKAAKARTKQLEETAAREKDANKALRAEDAKPNAPVLDATERLPSKGPRPSDADEGKRAMQELRAADDDTRPPQRTPDGVQYSGPHTDVRKSWDRAIRRYIDQGMREDEAYAKAWRDGGLRSWVERSGSGSHTPREKPPAPPTKIRDMNAEAKARAEAERDRVLAELKADEDARMQRVDPKPQEAPGKVLEGAERFTKAGESATTKDRVGSVSAIGRANVENVRRWRATPSDPAFDEIDAKHSANMLDDVRKALLGQAEAPSTPPRFLVRLRAAERAIEEARAVMKTDPARAEAILRTAAADIIYAGEGIAELPKPPKK